MIRNKLLRRQIARSFSLSEAEELTALLDRLGEVPGTLPADFADRLRHFLERVERSYDENDQSIELWQRSLDLSSRELLEANERLRAENLRNTHVLDSLRRSVQKLNAHAGGAGTGGSEAESLESLSKAISDWVTDRLLLEDGLRFSEQRFKDLTETSSDWFWEQDAQFRFIEMSGGLLKTLFDPSRTLGKRRWELPIVGVSEKEWRVHRDLLERHEPFQNFEYRIETEPGRLRWFSISGKPTFGRGGEFLGYCGTGKDITERKAAELALAQLNQELEQRVAERTLDLEQINQELESFSYSISHDLRAPLRAINGFAALLKESLAQRLSEEEVRHLERIEKNSVRMGELIDDILQYSRASRDVLKLEEVDLNQLARATVADLQEAYPAAKIEIGPLPGVKGDPVMLRQVFQNLIDNALKYSAKRAAPRVEIGARLQEGRRVYYVKDNGAGFDMRFAKKLFGVFQRMHPGSQFEGTGVGLAIVKRIVERHRGTVWAKSEPDKGTSLCFTLGENVGKPAEETKRSSAEASKVIDLQRAIHCAQMKRA